MRKRERRRRLKGGDEIGNDDQQKKKNTQLDGLKMNNPTNLLEDLFEDGEEEEENERDYNMVKIKSDFIQKSKESTSKKKRKKKKKGKKKDDKGDHDDFSINLEDDRFFHSLTSGGESSSLFGIDPTNKNFLPTQVI